MKSKAEKKRDSVKQVELSIAVENDADLRKNLQSDVKF